MVLNRKHLSAFALIFCALALAHSLDAVSLLDFGKSVKAGVAFDPLTKSGYIEQNGVFVSFALDQPFIACDWKELKKVGAPYLSGETIFLPADFVKETSKYLSEKNTPKKEKYSVATILVDPGHGGKDTGAIADFGDMRLLEKDLTLEVSKRVVDLLNARYPERNILITREGDSYPTLDDRVSMANSVELKNDEAVIYVSIHANASFNKNAKGFEVWYLNPEYRRTVVDANTVREKGTDIAPILNAMLEEEFTTESIILARNVYDRLGAALGSQSPGRGIRAEEWFVVRNAKMPSILIEMGFITNPEEGSLLSSSGYLRKIGDAIYNGIVDFIDHFER
ncbi:MAG TPA: N-acetylmuramoyl-L-alanine amidase [Rectinemataceae bacterium]|nr:N-acetylmuramoyl-L-alanine amidase [Rectinemataceae bacterium]